ncbi:MAG TPA: DUF4837 family protein [Flavobacterium sp.]|nr:DUF4837 family protein [Flavobacterium sp.]
MPNHLTVIIDDPLWNGQVGDSIRKKFASPIVGLPQEEPMLSITQYPLRLMEGYMSNDRNILVVKNDEKPYFRVEHNQHTNPQNVMYLAGRSVPELLDGLQKHTAQMLDIIRRTELDVATRQVDSAQVEREVLKDSFGIAMRIPQAYKQALKADNLVWFKKDMVTGNMNVLVYQVPMHCLERGTNIIGNITRMRDSVGALYIHGREAESRMITEKAFAPYLSRQTISGLKAYETRGIWELTNDYMSGPFINLSMVDKDKNRILVLEGFCYAPSQEKRELMLELEAILRTIAFEP